MFEKQHKALLQWYDVCGRKHLPWRNLGFVNGSYGVYISEIMLQQTQVSSVLGYYERFLQRFPTLHSLSLASEDEVLVLWAGLGYYSRAKNLLKTAKILKEALPNTKEALLKLPGIGEYTAGAILCFGFGQSVAFFDTNIKRFLMRFFALQNPKEKQLQEFAQKFLNTKDSFNHNQALLDLGALVCIASNPRCNICPLYDFCQGKNDISKYTLKKQISYEQIQMHLGIFEQNGRVAMLRDEKWNHLFSFPEISPKDRQAFATLKHTRTKYKIQVLLYHLSAQPTDTQMIERDSEKYPMSSLSLKVLKVLEKKSLENLSF